MSCTVQSLLSGNSSHNCENIIPGNQTHPSKVENMVYRECGEPCHLVKIERNCPAVGCYCKVGYMLNTTSGKCYKENVSLGFLQFVHLPLVSYTVVHTLHDGMQ